VLNPHLRPNRNKGERNNWGGGKNRGKEQKFGGVSNKGASDPNENQAEPSNNRSDPSGSSVASAEQLSQLLSQLNNLLQQQTVGSVLYKSNLFFSDQNNSSKIANLCHNTSKWIVDSGATDHMTWDQNKLENIIPTTESQHVIVANGNKVKIEGLGTTKNFRKDVNNILYLPDFNSNLLSINKITQDLNYKVIFSPHKVIFQD
jgi:hypothetical protein